MLTWRRADVAPCSQAKGVADAGSAAFRVSGLELGGLFGSLLAGRISDALIAKDPKGGNCGKRVQVWPPPPRPFTRTLPANSCGGLAAPISMPPGAGSVRASVRREVCEHWCAACSS